MSEEQTLAAKRMELITEKYGAGPALIAAATVGQIAKIVGDSIEIAYEVLGDNGILAVFALLELWVKDGRMALNRDIKRQRAEGGGA